MIAPAKRMIGLLVIVIGLVSCGALRAENERPRRDHMIEVRLHSRSGYRFAHRENISRTDFDYIEMAGLRATDEYVDEARKALADHLKYHDDKFVEGREHIARAVVERIRIVDRRRGRAVVIYNRPRDRD